MQDHKILRSSEIHAKIFSSVGPKFLLQSVVGPQNTELFGNSHKIFSSVGPKSWLQSVVGPFFIIPTVLKKVLT